MAAKDESVLRGWTYYVTTCVLISERDVSQQHRFCKQDRAEYKETRDEINYITNGETFGNNLVLIVI